jgi:hypothetical protein
LLCHKGRQPKQAETGDEDGQRVKTPASRPITFFIAEFFCIFLVGELVFENTLGSYY